MVNKRGQIYERNVRHAYLFLRRHFGSRSTVIPSPRGQDLSFSRWRRCYKSRGSFPVYLAAVVQKRSNAPVLGQKLATKVSKSRAIPPYVSGVTPPGWPLISALATRIGGCSFSSITSAIYWIFTQTKLSSINRRTFLCLDEASRVACNSDGTQSRKVSAEVFLLCGRDRLPGKILANVWQE